MVGALWLCSMATTEAEEIARDWNGFDKEEIVREFGDEIDLNERTYILTVSDLAKDGAKLRYRVSVVPKLKYAVNAKKCVFEVSEVPALQLELPGVVLRHRSLDKNLCGAAFSYDSTAGQLAGNRGDTGWFLARRYMQNLGREIQWEWRVMPVRRALFAFFKGQLLDTRKNIYTLLCEDWLAEAH